MDGNNIPVIPRTINELIESAGLLRIAHDHKATLLASCEIALGKRNETVAALQAENTKLRKVAIKLYNLGYHSGHEDTVEGCYTHIYSCDMYEYHNDVVSDILKDEGVTV